MSRNKWFVPIDDTNPCKSKPKKKTIQIYKDFTIIGQVVRYLEANSPTTARKIYDVMVDKHVVSDTPKGLQSIRRNVYLLQRYGTVFVDLSTRTFTPYYGTEALIYLKKDAQYRFK